ncbi:hypothetical protein LCGC14_0278200 [marine sediment metagenome]|uniref:Uncharacterized protein n=1 Tax=marine sediment metagenome TaxID=412755 RepID=A0A0F9UDN6_9ZZZZ
MSDKICMTRKEADYVWNCLPDWIKEVPGPDIPLDPTFFGTLSRETDLIVHNNMKKILQK